MKLKQFLLILLAFGCAQLPQSRTDKLSILQGVTSAKEVEFSVLAPKGQELRFELRNEKGEVLLPAEAKTVSRAHSPYAVHKLLFDRNQTEEHNLYVFEGEQLVDQRLVGKGSLDPDRLSLAVASCMNDFLPQHFKIWDEVQRLNPEYLLLIGDNVYADKAQGGEEVGVDPEILWDRYVEVRLRLPLYFQQRLIPVHALWDDHDFGVNDGGASFKHGPASLEIFQAFWAQDLAEEAWSPGFGSGGLLSLGDFNLYFIDGRSFRSPSPEGKHMGLDQEAWLLSKLRELPGPSFLIKGDQFFGAYHGGGSFEGSHPKDFTQFISELGKVETPFLFLSGDRHMSEVMQFPRGLFKKPSFEITSSPVHNSMTKNPTAENPWRVVAHDSTPNFVFIRNLARDNHWFLDVDSIGVDGKVLFHRELAVYIKDLQDNLQEVRKKRRTGKRSYKKRRNPRRRR